MSWSSDFSIPYMVVSWLILFSPSQCYCLCLYFIYVLVVWGVKDDIRMFMLAMFPSGSPLLINNGLSLNILSNQNTFCCFNILQYKHSTKTSDKEVLTYSDDNAWLTAIFLNIFKMLHRKLHSIIHGLMFLSKQIVRNNVIAAYHLLWAHICQGIHIDSNQMKWRYIYIIRVTGSVTGYVLIHSRYDILLYYKSLLIISSYLSV